MWLPAKLYEALPIIYVAIGALFLAGALYVGIDHWLMLGYATIGSLCVVLGAVISVIRRRARARIQPQSKSSEQLFV